SRRASASDSSARASAAPASSTPRVPSDAAAALPSIQQAAKDASGLRFMLHVSLPLQECESAPSICSTNRWLERQWLYDDSCTPLPRRLRPSHWPSRSITEASGQSPACPSMPRNDKEPLRTPIRAYEEVLPHDRTAMRLS